MRAPTGTITFLFTDIEGSTKLWEDNPEAMSAALVRHDALMHQVITAHDGVVFKTMGDAFFAAFASAPAALSAALSAQQTIQSKEWPGGISLPVRMALHIGLADERDGDYFGPPLNRVARLLSAAHGGQVLLSLAACELTRDMLPLDCSLRDMGSHALRDLGRPEHVFQLLHPELQSQFPPLRSLDSPDLPNNLPQQVTSFVGRDKELRQIKTLLAKTRLLTLTGAGGSGKTRLSLQAAADVLDRYPDGVWLIELASISEPSLLPQAIGNALSIKEQPGQTLTQTLTAWLKPKHLLLLLDNCEHVLAACASLATSLLRACPQVHILASSREGLGIAGEQTYRVPSLSLPDPKQKATAESLSHYEAVQLFLDRAQIHKPDFAVTNQNAPAVASVCHRVDGIPFALELAAARIRSLSVEEVDARLDNRFRLLTGGSRTALPRQQTLRALIDWSYDLLTEPEKSLLCGLSVFTGGWTLEAAETVCTSDALEDWEVFDLLSSLVDKSLVSTEEENGQTRYQLLETVRQYGRDKLAESGADHAAGNKHAAYYLGLAESAARDLRGSEQVALLSRLETEHDNIRASLAWLSELPEDAGANDRLRLAGLLYGFWSVRGHLGEGRRYLSDALSAPGAQARTPERARALNGAGVLAHGQGDYAEARTLLQESLSIHREIGHKDGIALTLSCLGNIAYSRNDYAQARSLYEEALEIRRERQQASGIADALVNLGNVARQEGDYALAYTRYEESLTIARQLKDKDGIAYALLNLGNMASLQGNHAQARPLLEESLPLYQELGNKEKTAHAMGTLGYVAFLQQDYAEARLLLERGLVIVREMGDKRGTATALNVLGNVAYSQGEYAEARILQQESLTLNQELGNNRGIAYNLEGIGRVCAAQGDLTKAARFWGAAEALRETMGGALLTLNQSAYDRALIEVREKLGDAAFEAAWAEGRAMTLEQAVTEVRRR